MMTIIQVGHDEASDRYIRNKMRAVEKEGLEAELVSLPENCETRDVLDAIFMADINFTNRAIMVQLPLPEHLNKEHILHAIPTNKDIDGLNPHSDFKPLTPCAIMRWFHKQHIALEGKNAVIFGRSALVGKPLANMLIDAGATVTVCNSHTHAYERGRLLRHSDIVVSAVGKADFIRWSNADGMKDDVVVVDVGINKGTDGKLCGDVSEQARDLINRRGGTCTPVPGGVGKWTVQELVLRLKMMEGI